MIIFPLLLLWSFSYSTLPWLSFGEKYLEKQIVSHKPGVEVWRRLGCDVCWSDKLMATGSNISLIFTLPCFLPISLPCLLHSFPYFICFSCLSISLLLLPSFPIPLAFFILFPSHLTNIPSFFVSSLFPSPSLSPPFNCSTLPFILSNFRPSLFYLLHFRSRRFPLPFSRVNTKHVAVIIRAGGVEQ